MFKLNNDILYLIFKELQNNKKVLLSGLTVNKTWCETIVPILWRNPWKYLKNNKLEKKLLLNTIITQLSDESRNNLKSQGVDFPTNPYQRPLFDYMSFCRYLNLNNINEIINIFIDNINEKSVFLIVREEILKLFINKNTRLTHLCIPHQFDYQINLILDANLCFSELEFLSCNTSISNNVLNGLIEICKPIKELELIIEKGGNNYEIINLIKAMKRLFNVNLHYLQNEQNDESFCRILEGSLVTHANSIRYFKMTGRSITKFISSFVNLNKLELIATDHNNVAAWNCLKNLSLPFIRILKARSIPIEALVSLIKNTNGCLTTIKIDYIAHTFDNNKCIIQAIYQSCPNLEYLKLFFKSSNILELNNLLNNCQYLSKLHIIIDNYFESGALYNWDYLFEVLTSSSPACLYNLKFCFDEAPTLESLKLFLDNWKNRRSMLLKTMQINDIFLNPLNFWSDKHLDLLKEYKAKGIVKRYYHCLH
ncbi:hypothetical protein RclHR1_08990009 [Rhizophagus clarus]|uniref:F-box domain-containing protein n=1 Tax=Rhizophagus clarus TaxID=94130 RepID=A0A2Z6SDD1_9GLOM|nr:hypothetical protein RclHR1_08990009 [Rhizophagus clarus]GES84955.1 hypothetical protein GLOIN_2v1784962 [Rhizophagus clarus]